MNDRISAAITLLLMSLQPALDVTDEQQLGVHAGCAEDQRGEEQPAERRQSGELEGGRCAGGHRSIANE